MDSNLKSIRNKLLADTNYLASKDLLPDTAWVPSANGNVLVTAETLAAMKMPEDQEEGEVGSAEMEPMRFTIVGTVSHRSSFLAPDGAWKGRGKSGFTKTFHAVNLTLALEKPVGFDEFSSDWDLAMSTVQGLYESSKTPAYEIHDGFMKGDLLSFKHALFTVSF